MLRIVFGKREAIRCARPRGIPTAMHFASGRAQVIMCRYYANRFAFTQDSDYRRGILRERFDGRRQTLFRVGKCHVLTADIQRKTRSYVTGLKLSDISNGILLRTVFTLSNQALLSCPSSSSSCVICHVFSREFSGISASSLFGDLSLHFPKPYTMVFFELHIGCSSRRYLPHSRFSINLSRNEDK